MIAAAHVPKQLALALLFPQVKKAFGRASLLRVRIVEPTALP